MQSSAIPYVFKVELLILTRRGTRFIIKWSILSFPSGVSVLLWHGCPHVQCPRDGDCTWKGIGTGRGNSAALPFDCVQCSKWDQPNPVGVSMYSREQGWGGIVCLCHMAFLLLLMFGTYCYTQRVKAAGHFRWPDMNIRSPLILSFIISPFVCNASSLSF